MRYLLRILILLELLIGANVAFANPADFTVLGVITSSKDKKGVALMKNKKDGKVSAYKEGDEVVKGTKIKSILRKTVTFSFERKLYELSVGEDSPKEVKDNGAAARSVASNLSKAEGIEKTGDTLKVSRALKDSLASGEGLNKILMQAATIPYVENGKLIGFRILEIDPGSIFDVAGFQNGDIITHINDQPINDAGLAIRALGSLKAASSASFSYLRGSTPMNLKIDIH
ncbi:MAG: PDZ domain-containing protein [Chitinophagaceae bacterium]|nr:PDZ domain-containing protein [Oligoflexus sp.]